MVKLWTFYAETAQKLKLPKTETAQIHLSYVYVRSELHWPLLETSRKAHLLTHVFKAKYGLSPTYMSSLLCTTHRNTRGSLSGNLFIPQPVSKLGKKTFSFLGSKLRNFLPPEAKQTTNIKHFTSLVLSSTGP